MKEGIDVRVLAGLARVHVSDAEIAALEKELPGILAFVRTVQGAIGEVSNVEASPRNVMREDTGAHESGVYSEDLLAAAPAHRGGRVVVKQVVSRAGQ